MWVIKFKWLNGVEILCSDWCSIDLTTWYLTFTQRRWADFPARGWRKGKWAVFVCLQRSARPCCFQQHPPRRRRLWPECHWRNDPCTLVWMMLRRRQLWRGWNRWASVILNVVHDWLKPCKGSKFQRWWKCILRIQHFSKYIHFSKWGFLVVCECYTYSEYCQWNRCPHWRFSVKNRRAACLHPLTFPMHFIWNDDLQGCELVCFTKHPS